jgi:hypothetical protein
VHSKFYFDYGFCGATVYSISLGFYSKKNLKSGGAAGVPLLNVCYSNVVEANVYGPGAAGNFCKTIL